MAHRRRIVETLYGLQGGQFEPIPYLERLDLLEDEELAPLTRLTQRYIYEEMHPDPSTCSQLQFIVLGEELNDNGFGLGSCIHQGGWELSMALQTGRQLVFHPNYGRQLYDKGFANLFEQPSSCGLEHVNENNSISIFKYGGHPGANSHVAGLEFVDNTPPFLVTMLQELYADRHIELSPLFLKYWWRAQSAAYLARPNKEILKELAELRLRADMFQHLTQRGQPSRFTNPLFPLPPGTVHVHVRHGRKGIQMQLKSLPEYLLAAEERLVDTNPLFYKKMAFLSSDDTDVFRQAADVARVAEYGTSPDGNWTLIASNDPRVEQGGLEWIEAVAALGPKIIVRHLLNLFVALECGAWVGTRGSNWDRLVDELRCVWMEGCRLPYVEVGTHDGNWHEYDW